MPFLKRAEQQSDQKASEDNGQGFVELTPEQREPVPSQEEDVENKDTESRSGKPKESIESRYHESSRGGRRCSCSRSRRLDRSVSRDIYSKKRRHRDSDTEDEECETPSFGL